MKGHALEIYLARCRERNAAQCHTMSPHDAARHLIPSMRLIQENRREAIHPAWGGALAVVEAVQHLFDRLRIEMFQDTGRQRGRRLDAQRGAIDGEEHFLAEVPAP